MIKNFYTINKKINSGCFFYYFPSHRFYKKLVWDPQVAESKLYDDFKEYMSTDLKKGYISMYSNLIEAIHKKDKNYILKTCEENLAHNIFDLFDDTEVSLYLNKPNIDKHVISIKHIFIEEHDNLSTNRNINKDCGMIPTQAFKLPFTAVRFPRKYMIGVPFVNYILYRPTFSSEEIYFNIVNLFRKFLRVFRIHIHFSTNFFLSHNLNNNKQDNEIQTLTIETERDFKKD